MSPLLDQNREYWFALRVKPRHEMAVSRALSSKGYEQFLPLRKDRRRWSDREKQISSPLFPGYVFCRFNPWTRVQVLETPGVRSILSFGNGPEPVDEEQIGAVQRIIQSGAAVEPHPYMEIGQVVRLTDGPLRGLEGILECSNGATYLVVSVTLMQRSVAVQVSREFVQTAVRPTMFREQVA